MPQNLIGVVDYGINNVGSVVNSLKDLELAVTVVNNPNDLKKVQKIILPGVGAYATAMDYLRKTGIFDQLNEEVLINQKPFLGICLGMQLIFAKSYEFGATSGFGWIDGEVLAFPTVAPSVPHIGWNEVVKTKRDSILLSDFDDHANTYFVHSFAVFDTSKAWSIGVTNHGMNFASVVEFENIFATQFHPEKSQGAGAILLKNFGML